MKTSLVFDLETTGLPTGTSIYELKNYDTCRVVQICWTIVSLPDLSEVEPMKNRFVIPQDHKVHPDMFCVKHGMSHEHLTENGIPLRTVIQELRADIAKWSPSFLMGHNVIFDVLGLMAEVYRLYGDVDRPYHLFRHSDGAYPRTFCTFEMSKNCRKKKIAPFGDMGSLKLSHVYKVIAQRDLENAHKADADVRACIEIARFIFARCEIIWEVLETLERNYDKALLFTTQNKKEWLSRVTNHL